MKLPSLFRSNDAFRELTRLQSDIDKLFREMNGFETRMDNGSVFAPSCEVTETKESYMMTFDLPGVKKEDVKIEVEGNRISVSAERREEKKTDDKKQHYSEISYGSYQRSFTMPSAIEQSKVEAKFDNGVLKVTLPKNASSNVKQIAVH